MTNKQRKTKKHYDDLWNATKEHQGKTLGVYQMLKSLQYIDYNTDVRDLITTHQYRAWRLNNAYMKFKQRLHDMIFSLMEHIIEFDEDYNNAKWQ